MALKRRGTSKFTITISHNDEPIIVRYFNTDGFNTDVKRSVDINDLMYDIVGFIRGAFKKKDIEYMYDEINLKEDAFTKKWKAQIKNKKR